MTGNYERIYIDRQTFDMIPIMLKIYEKYHPDTIGIKKSAGFICKKAFIKYIEDDQND